MMWQTHSEYLKVSKALQKALKQVEPQAKAYLNLLKTYSEMALMLLTNKPKKD
jgi:hypothetical protein